MEIIRWNIEGGKRALVHEHIESCGATRVVASIVVREQSEQIFATSTLHESHETFMPLLRMLCDFCDFSQKKCVLLDTCGVCSFRAAFKLENQGSVARAPTICTTTHQELHVPINESLQLMYTLGGLDPDLGKWLQQQNTRDIPINLAGVVD